MNCSQITVWAVEDGRSDSYLTAGIDLDVKNGRFLTTLTSFFDVSDVVLSVVFDVIDVSDVVFDSLTTFSTSF